MPRMKKLLQHKKKVQAPTPDFAITAYSFLNPVESDLQISDRRPIEKYWDTTYINHTASQNFAIYYYGHMTGKLSNLTRTRCESVPNRGMLFVHIESGLSRDLFKTYLKFLNEKHTWKDYYRSILTEKLHMPSIHLMEYAQKFGLAIKFVSTTPRAYSLYVEEWMERHNLKRFTTIPIQYKATWRTKDAMYLENIAWDTSASSTRGQLYFIFDQRRFPRLGWNPINTYF